ncbi:hypothetical protein [Pseudoxanthomonas sp. 10H]|uniref:hypothetical protein n=1 Tax=Pseudoxanthomonas sp. 10H TaxID=3242729 RepID=UPI0035581CB1
MPFLPVMTTINYQKTLKFEIARELINGRIAELSELIGIEEKKPLPNMTLIGQLEDQMLLIAEERGELDVTNEAALDASIAKNGRPPP